MSKTKIVKYSAYEMAMMIWREIIAETGVYETVKSTPSSMDDPSVHVLEYRSYLFSVSVVFTLKDILGQSNFVSTEYGGFLNFLRIWKYWIIPVRSKRTLDHITNIIWCWRLCRILISLFSYFLDISYLIEYISIFMNIVSENVIVSSVCNGINPVEFFY